LGSVKEALARHLAAEGGIAAVLLQMIGKIPAGCDQAVSVIDTGYHGRTFFFVMEVRAPGARGRGLVVAGAWEGVLG
jgi:hypothetical protein